jgi:hypothetical protein
MFMKKLKACWFFVFVFIFISVGAVYAEDIDVLIDGEYVNFMGQGPVIVDERTLVPVRGVFEELDFVVGWDENLRQATLTRGNNVIVITVDSDIFTTNGVSLTLDVPAQIIGGRTLLPIRAVLASVGYYVFWDAPTNTVEIYSEYIPHDLTVIEQITIPDRRLTDEEISAWITAYTELGGPGEFEIEVIRLINIERAAAGLNPLELYEPLMMAARFKAQSMSDLDYFSHESPVYGAFQNISREIFGIPPRSMGENLASGHRTPEAVVQGWMNSEAHRNNIMNPDYTRIGVGFHNNYWAQKFTA